MTVSWRVTPEKAWGDVTEAQVNQAQAEIVAFCNSLTGEIAAWMKEEARWTDRTGDARDGLYSDVIRLATHSVSILMSHGPMIHYSYYLEVVRGGYFSILPETVDRYLPIVFRGVQEILNRTFRG